MHDSFKPICLFKWNYENTDTLSIYMPTNFFHEPYVSKPIHDYYPQLKYKNLDFQIVWKL